MAVGRHLRKHWKKYALITSTWLGSRWAAKRFREATITAAYCKEAKEYNDKSTTFNQSIDRVYVFLNPTANNKDAKRQFMKYSAPILHLSGAEVIVIETDYEGQAQTLLNYIQTSTAAVLVAGGSGTLMEVINGVLKRTELDIPIGVIPLGKNNLSFKHFFGDSKNKREFPARVIGEATMNIIRGKTRPVDALKLQPEKGNTLYAVDSIDWGVVYDAEENKNSWRIFGCFRTFFSYLNTALRKWPVDFSMDIETSLSCIDTITEIRNTKTIKPVSFRLHSTNDRLLTLDWLSSYDNSLQWTFIKQGFMRSLYKDKDSHNLLVYDTVKASKFNIVPSSNGEEWYSVDGEPFEALSLRVTLEKDKFRIFDAKTSYNHNN